VEGNALPIAVAHGIRCILFDSGWYGHPLDEATDATTVEPWEKKLADPDSHGGLDLPRVLDYSKSKGIGVWLYVDQHGLERQLHRIVPLFAKWGVPGIKFGFVHVGPQGWSKWLIDAVAFCAQHRLMVDIHDEFRPAGVQRTWPNLVNAEGIRGNEEFPSAAHNVTLPFTRFVDGPADYTVCIYSPRLKRRRTHQLAMTVCYFSPFELLYWYDRPEQFAGEPELAFLDIVPTVWDGTRILDGYPGEFVVIARRAEDEWFLGGMNGESLREIAIPLGFLHGELACTVYCDGEGGRNYVEIRRRRLGPADALEATLLPSGGLAAHFRKS
jgi:alpha-glucosidase